MSESWYVTVERANGGRSHVAALGELCSCDTCLVTRFDRQAQPWPVYVGGR